MARFLITVWPLAGHLYPNLALATALRERGHEVAFYTSARASATVAREGFACLPFQAVDGDGFEAMMASGYATLPAWARWRHQKELYRAWLVDTLPAQLADLEATLDQWRPDAIVCDPTMWAPILVLHEKRGIPVAVFSYTVGCLLPGPETPPAGPGLPSPRTWGARWLCRAYDAMMRLATQDIRRAANAVRRQHGLAELRVTVTEHAGTMPLYLVTSSPELDYGRRHIPKNVHYVGPCLWSRADPDPPEWMKKVPTEQPWVHVSEGTQHNQAPFLLRAAAAGLAAQPMQVIMATGSHRRPEEIGLDHLAPNIHVHGWVPYAHLIPRTAAVVTAGGAGTVLSALQAGVPLVVAPTEWDKPENAQRVAESGAGIRIAPTRCTPRRLREAVERVLREPAFRTNARRIAQSFACYGGPQQAAALIEGLV